MCISQGSSRALLQPQPLLPQLRLPHVPCRLGRAASWSRLFPASTAASRGAAPTSSSRVRFQAEARQRNRGASNGSSSSKPASSSEPVLSFNAIFQGGHGHGGASSNGKGFGKHRGKKGGQATVHFSIVKQLEYGQGIRLAGDAPTLGAWDHSKGPELKWHEGHKWSTEVELAPGGHEFKFLLVHRSGYLDWEPGTNRTIEVPNTAAELQVVGKWGAPEDTEVLELQQQPDYQQQLKQQLEQQLQQQPEEVLEAAAPVSRAVEYTEEVATEAQVAIPATALAADEELMAVDWKSLDTDVPENRHLMQVLLGFQQDMMDGLSGVSLTMQEIQDELSAVQQQVAQLSAGQLVEQAFAATARLSAGTPPSDLDLPFASDADLLDATSIPVDADGNKDEALMRLHTAAVLSWRQELLSFRQDTVELRQELEDMRQSLGGQVSENTAAIQDLELLVKHLIGTSGGGSGPPPSGASGRAGTPVAGASGGWSPPAAGKAAAPAAKAGKAPGTQGEVLDHEDRMLLEHINHLASDLSVEMKEAVHELEMQQQTLFERHQHIIVDAADRGARGSPGGAPGGSGMAATAARWLEGRQDSQLFYEGLLVTVMMSCGLWSPEVWEELQGKPLQTTWTAYLSTWDQAGLQAWKDTIDTKQQLLSALISGRQQLLAMHLLWSLQELSTHSAHLKDTLGRLGTSIELGLMQKLRQQGGAGRGWALGVPGAPSGGGEAAAAAQCAVVLQRWLAAWGAR